MLPKRCCPIFFSRSGAEEATSAACSNVLSLTRMARRHPFFVSNSVVRASINNFFHLTEKNTKRGGAAITISTPEKIVNGCSSSYDRLFTHSKLFADACLLSKDLHRAVILNNRNKKRSFYSSSPPARKGAPECGAANIAIHISPGYDFAVALLAVWLAKCRAVPLNVNATDSEIDHILRESDTRIVLTEKHSASDERSFLKTDDVTTAARNVTSENTSIFQLPIDFSSTAEHSLTSAHREAIQHALQTDAHHPTSPGDDALLVFTSGTTGLPKAAVHSHASVSNQVDVLLKAWDWSPQDSILHTLPLHHVHGLINCLCCGLAASANVEFLVSKKFDPISVVKRLESGDISLFFSVPTAYKKLLSYLETRSQMEQEEFKKKMQEHIRLFISGSSAMPVPILEAFEEKSGQKLLERWGMTEIGMGLSQSYFAPEKRIPGTVGLPLPTVEVKLHSTTTTTGKENENENEKSSSSSTNNDLLVRSGSMFSRYWGKEQKTIDAFIEDPETPGKFWFDTGDSVRRILDEDTNLLSAYAIQGRTSVDIMKISGFKISAVEIENALLNTGLLEECAVFAMNSSGNDTEDAEMMVCVFTPSEEEQVATSGTHSLTIDKLKEELNKKFSSYKRPRRYICEPNGIERNAMGKINKKALVKKYQEEIPAGENADLEIDTRPTEQQTTQEQEQQQDREQEQNDNNNNTRTDEFVSENDFEGMSKKDNFDIDLGSDGNVGVEDLRQAISEEEDLSRHHVDSTKEHPNLHLKERKKIDEKMKHRSYKGLQYKGMDLK